MIKEYYGIKIEELSKRKDALEQEYKSIKSKKSPLFQRIFRMKDGNDVIRMHAILDELLDLNFKIEILEHKKEGKEAFQEFINGKEGDFEEEIAQLENEIQLPVISNQGFFRRLYNRFMPRGINDFLTNYQKINKLREQKEDLRYIKLISSDEIIEIQQLVKQGELEYEISGDDKVIGEFMLDFSNNNNSTLFPKFSKLDDFMLVHKTNYLPTNDTIYTPKSTNARRPVIFEFRGEKFEIDSAVSNDTTHLTLNGPVSEFEGGNEWDKAKYAIVCGFNDVNRDNLITVNLEDTYFDGNVTVNQNGFLLIPKSELKGQDSFKRSLNHNITIVPYENISLDEAIYSLISITGKRPKRITNDGWVNGDNNDIQDAKAVFENNNISFGGKHYNSKAMSKRLLQQRAYIMISVYEFLKKRGLAPSKQELLDIVNANTNGGTHAKEIVEYLYGEDTIKNDYLKAFEEHGYEIPQEMFEDERIVMMRQKGVSKESMLDICDSYMFKILQNGGRDDNIKTRSPEVIINE